jgi:hypothetical protein
VWNCEKDERGKLFRTSKLKYILKTDDVVASTTKWKVLTGTFSNCVVVNVFVTLPTGKKIGKRITQLTVPEIVACRLQDAIKPSPSESIH